jgi:hypothetical protein
MAGGIEFHHVRFGAGRVTAQNPAPGQNDARLEHRHVTDIGVPRRKRPYDFAIQTV